MEFKEYFRVAVDAAKRAGKLLQSEFSEDAFVSSCEGKDIKTEADKSAEALILAALSKTGIPILAEESGECGEVDLSRECWIVDPLDGTFNFVRGLPPFCVSIALWRSDAPVFGIIYDIASGALYTGFVGSGAFCDGVKIEVSDTSSKEEAVLATGFPSQRSYSSDSILESLKSIQSYKKIRMIGSAAMSLAFVGKGAVDAYYEEGIWIWDVAAGLAIVKAAGGNFEISNIKKNRQLDVYASNGILKK